MLDLNSKSCFGSVIENIHAMILLYRGMGLRHITSSSLPIDVTTPVRGLIDPGWEEGWGCLLGSPEKKTLDRWQDIVFKICFSDQKYIPGKYDVLLKIYGINIKNIYIYIPLQYYTPGTSTLGCSIVLCLLTKRNQANKCHPKGTIFASRAATQSLHEFYPYLYLSRWGSKSHIVVLGCGYGSIPIDTIF